MSFPNDFLWGAASSSAQIEGAWDEGGRTPSIWDLAPKRKIRNGDNPLDGCDHFHRMKADVALMKELGLKCYRFSISWPRVEPENGVFSEKGIGFYSDLVDELINAGIEPVVTLYHWDLPLWAHKAGGWTKTSIVGLFTAYVSKVVSVLSDRVRFWIPLNEPQCFIGRGYLLGKHAPFSRKVFSLPGLTKNCLLAHKAAVDVIRREAKRAPLIGIAMCAGAYIPKDESEKEIEKAVNRIASGVEYDELEIEYKGDNNDGDFVTVNNWNDVLAVFAVRYASGTGDALLIEPSDETEEQLREVFYAMNTVTLSYAMEK